MPASKATASTSKAASSGKAAAPLSERDEKILDAILLEARKNHGDAKLTLMYLLKAYESVLGRFGIDAKNENHYYRILLQWSLDAEPTYAGWRAMLDGSRKKPPAATTPRSNKPPAAAAKASTGAVLRKVATAASAARDLSSRTRAPPVSKAATPRATTTTSVKRAPTIKVSTPRAAPAAATIVVDRGVVATTSQPARAP